MSTPVPPESPFSRERREAYVRSTQQHATAEPTHAGTPTQPFPYLPYLIGLGGLKESGKDVVADTLTENDTRQRPVVKIGMSDILNEILIVLNPWIPGVSFPERDTMRYAEHVETVGYNEAKKNPEVRRLLQAIGNDVGRDMLSPSIWVTVAAKKIHAHLAQGHSVIVTGIRNPNEIAMIAMNGGATVYVERPSLRTRNVDPHASENSVTSNDFDRILINDATLGKLRLEALAMELHIITRNEAEQAKSGYSGLVMPTSTVDTFPTPLSAFLHTDEQMANIVGRTPTTARPTGKRHCTCTHLDPWKIDPTCERHKHLLAKTVPESGHDEV